MRVWVVGSGGMLGGALTVRARAAGARVFAAAPIPWAQGDQAQTVLREQAGRFAEWAGQDPWLLLWAAGASVIASGSTGVDDELDALGALLAAVAEAPPGGPGAVFLASSAGGVYAGSADPPFTRETVPVPISPYGRLKLAQEELATDLLDGRVPLVIGRLSNLYGPGHNTEKGQGLIPLLCRACVRRVPLNLYVSMDTLRDYLYVDDAADLVWRATRPAVGQSPPAVRTEVVASGRAVSVAEVVATIQTVAHRRVPLALGTDPSARHQAADLRLVPTIESGVLTPLPNGIRRVFDAAVARAV
jgi:UDP-glucose 4-epimerase